MVPLYVRFGDEMFRDYADITPDQFYGRLKDAPEPPKTSQPTPADFAGPASPPIAPRVDALPRRVSRSGRCSAVSSPSCCA